MIVHNEVEELDNCLMSIAPYVGGIYVLNTGYNPQTSLVLNKYKAVYKMDDSAGYKVDKKMIKWLTKFFGWIPESKLGDMIFQFDKARNKAMELIPKSYKYFIWLDADDVFRGGAKLEGVLKRMDDVNASAMFMNYLYDVELEGSKIKNILIQHLRERVILNNGQYKWVAPIHETLIAQSGDVRQLDTKDCDIIHMSTRDKKAGAIVRNIKALEKSIYDLDGKDPRPIYYLAKAYFDLHTEENHKKAEKLIYRYLKSSGWAEERSQAYEYLAEIFRERKEYNKAIKAAMNAQIESPKFPSTYLSLALTYLLIGRIEDAMFYVQLASKVPTPQTTLVIQPRDMVARALEVVFNCSMKTNQLDEAWASILKLKEMFPDDVNIENQWKFVDGIKYQRELTKVYVGLAKVIEASGDKHKLAAIAEAAPNEIKDNPIVAEFVRRVKPPKTWSDKSVVIFCGQGWTPWSPEFYKKKTSQTFVGGSEEAVILATQELVKQGYEVTVYGDPGTEGVYDGVNYLNHFKFNSNDNFNILIGWRNISLFDIKFKAKKTYLWLHDVPVQLDYKKERLDNITKIMVLSKAQRELLPTVPDEKFFYTSNGFKEEHPEIKSDNIPTRAIWSSSYDRGLQHLLDVWEEVRRIVPKAELRVFYGWQLFDKFYANNPERMKWKDKIEESMKRLGVYHGGRLEQGEIEKEYKKAGVWTYPTDFYEINCISAIKAQAYGAVPVTMNYAALKETVQHGVKVEGDIWDKETRDVYTQALIKELKNSMSKNDRKRMMGWAKDKYNWSEIVKSWISEFNL